jgi:nitrite reductase/ring-hydroxylating ferredoxin subunit
MNFKLVTRIVVPVILITVLILTGCNAKGTTTSPAVGSISTYAGVGVSSSDNQRYKPTWITPTLSGEQVSIPLSAVEQGKMVHFWVSLPSGKEAFMAYKLDGVNYMRADICVPCRSSSFSLQKGVLVCDTCGTTFDAKTGKGISGACKNYPKDAVTWQLDAGNLVATVSNLKVAYETTLQPG